MYNPGQRVTLRNDRADAYGLPKGAVYTIHSTRAHARLKRTWIVLAELIHAGNGNGTVDSREVRPA